MKTTYISPTETKGSKIRANRLGHQKTIRMDYSLNLINRHRRAVEVLLKANNLTADIKQ